MTKKCFWKMFISVSAVGIGCLIRSEYERKHLKITEYVVVSSKLTREWDGYTLVLLSDLHDKEFGLNNQILIDAINKVHPDRIVSSGDLICCSLDGKGKPGKLEVSLKLLKTLKNSYPVTCGNGNHEQRLREHPQVFGNKQKQYVEELKRYGIDYLQNETIVVQGKDSNLVIRGLDIEPSYYKKKGKIFPLEDNYVEKRLGKSSKNDFEILLAHSPQFLEGYADWGADLVCSGHFHGGTIRLPLLGGVMTPQYQFFYKRDKGIHKLGDTTMVVSGGLGTHSINIRLNNFPEVVVIRLKREA